MKKILTLIIMILCATVLFAQAPEKFTYQAVVRNASNALVANAPVSVRVSILQGGVNGTIVYMETQTAVTNANGLITLQIGGGNVQQGIFADIDWANGPFFLKTEIDPNGGSNYSVTSTQQLLSVPYAIYAKEAGNGFGGDYNDLINTPEIPTVPNNVSAFVNDAGYITMDSVPTNVSVFTNDAGYLTSYTETDPQFNAWDKDYNDLINTPTIPTVPTNVSAFVNDAGYLTAIPDSIGVISIESDPVFSAWNKDYNDLINTPEIPQIPENVSTFNNDAGYITMDSVPTVPTDVSAFNNDVGYLTTYTETQSLADVTAQGNSAGNLQLKNVSDPTENLDAVNLQTLISQINSLQDDFQQQIQQMQQQLQQQMQQMQHQIDSLQDVVNSLDTNHNTAGDAVIDEKSCPGTPTVTDHEGNVYATVQIGNQCWMRDNLRTTTSPSTGTYLIPPAGTDYTYSGKQAFWYDNDSATYAPMNYGLLYNWNAAVDTFNTSYGETSVNTDNAVSVIFTGNRRGICPAGWHLPSDAEWTQLTNYVRSQSEYTCGGNSSYIAKALASTEGWNSYSGEFYPGDQSMTANNATGFSAVPAGYCSSSSFLDAGYSANFWSSTEYSSYNAWYRYMLYYNAAVSRNLDSKNDRFSVRCLLDETGGGTSFVQPTVTTSNATNITSASATLNGYISNPDNVAIITQGFEWKVTEDGTYTTVNATGETMSYTLTGLTVGTGYTYRAYVTTAIGTSYGSEVDFSTTAGSPTSFNCGTSKMQDAVGNEYETVQLGTQCWTKTNLRTTKAADGSDIPVGGGSCMVPYYYDNSSHSLPLTKRGYLYNYEAAKLVCPTGWHLPSDAEWTQLTDYVSSQSGYTCGDNSSYIAKALASMVGWNSYSGECCPGDQSLMANNATGFGAFPVGDWYNGFLYAGVGAPFWSSTEYDTSNAWNRSLTHGNAGVYRGSVSKYYGYSVRCLHD